ncbi:MAG TPA: hypothetical protein VMJ64_05355 [Anaerolineales bacterium]|nr:hypothetical protein [Anaerolineales bacterium]
MWRRSFQLLAILLLAGTSILSTLQYWMAVYQTWKVSLTSGDPVSRWEHRLSRIQLPTDIRNEVGYVADWDIDPTHNPTDQDEEYVLTQYTLAPLIIKRGANYPWIIGNFTLPGADDWLSQNFKDAKIHHYGYGIYLIHKLGP